ncbi:MAG: hypothetical protein WAX85_00845 [Minisyncoccia bacterium]
MQILTVIPISKGISKDTLTYFTKKDVSLGSIVSVPLRKKNIFGLVTGSEIAQEIKSELKSLSYSIRKIDNIKSHSFLSKEFLEAVKAIADHNAGSVGAVLSALIPNAILLNNSELTYVKKESKKGSYETVLLQSDNDERYATYKSLIREEFARGHSVFFCLPTTEDLLSAKPILEKGIEKYTYILHSRLPKKEIISLWKKIVSENHTVLIIATGSFLSIPRDDIGTFVFEKESSRAYKMQTRPFIDIRTAGQFIAKEYNSRVVFGDTLLRTETLWREKNGEYAELSPLKFRSLTTANCEIVNMKAPQDMKRKEFTVLSENLKNLLRKAKENNEHTFLFCGRKGLYPITVCSDCGTVVVCKNCSAPVVLYGKRDTLGKNKNLFVCHHCGERRDAHELCIHCGGWRLNPLGIGVEKVVEEVKNLLNSTQVVVMDKDHVTTHKQAIKARELFYNTPGAVMVGTEMALTYLNQKIENSSVVSIDSYFSVPDFQINEKIFHILLELRNLSEKNMIIQTRQENTKIFDHASKGDLIDFYRDEIKDRELIGYPPFTTYIKITISGEKNSVKKQMAEITEVMKPYEFSIFDAWNPGSKSKFSMHGLVSLPKGAWLDKTLLVKLRELPQNVIVKIDPDTLL